MNQDIEVSQSGTVKVNNTAAAQNGGFWPDFAASTSLRKWVTALVAAGMLAPAERANPEIFPPNLEPAGITALLDENEEISTLNDTVVRSINRAELMSGVVRQYRLENNIPLAENDDSGWIGLPESEITSVRGSLKLKTRATDEKFAGKIVLMFSRLGLEKEDPVAIGSTGSLPAINAYVRAACNESGLKATSILSAASSQYGANIPELPYVTIENLLVEKKLIKKQSVAASLGGYRDQALDVEDKDCLIDAVKEAGLPLITADTLAGSIEKRMEIYGDLSRYKLYINVGGGRASIGGTKEVKSESDQEQQEEISSFRLPDGIIHPGSVEYENYNDCVAIRFLKAGIPVLNLRHVNEDIYDKYQVASIENF